VNATTRRLGRSDLTVSALGLGCWPLGGALATGEQPRGYAGIDEGEALRALHRGIEAGVTLVDTADVYGAGHSERLLAPVLAAHPEVLVATKFGNVFDEETKQMTGSDTSPAYVRSALQASLRRLGRDRIDLYQLHASDVDDARAAELVEALEQFVAEGTVRWYGISTDDPGRADAFAAGPHCTAIQLQLNVFDDNTAMLAACDRHDLAALCRSPLAMGLLGGRYTADSTLPVDDVRGRQPEWLRWFTDGRPTPEFLDRLDLVRDVLTADGRTLAQGALAWIWAHHGRTIPIPGFRNTAQIKENTGALAIGPLKPAEHDAVERALGRAG
jgi:aryl-alcohol dehydrogenase-like predicted oxidoreductase